MTDCRNCGSVLTDRFCSRCGQKADTRRIGWTWLVDEVMGSVFVVDRGILFTVKELFTRPGHAIREFLEGRRKPHFKPLSTLLLTATVYSLFHRWMKPDLGKLMQRPEELAVIETINTGMGQYYALMELAMVPLFALCSWMVLRKFGHNYVEHMVIQSYLTGQRIVASIVFVPLNVLGMEASLLGSMVLTSVYMAGYFITFLQLYADRPPLQVLLRALFAFAMFLAFVVLLAAGGIALLASKGYWPG